MDRVFLEYYEDELDHVRGLAKEFAAIHPAVAKNLSIDVLPCPDPYVERLLEGVAYLTARTRLKVDGERSRFARNILDALYPDLVAPAPAVSSVILHPGPQVDTMVDGHVVERGTRLVSTLREGMSTRTTYTTAQDVTLWPIEIGKVAYLQDRGALVSAGVSERQVAGAECGLAITLKRRGHGPLGELDLDRLELSFPASPTGGAIFDAIHGGTKTVLARPTAGKGQFREAGRPEIIGIRDSEALLPRSRPTFEGYRLLREYFVMPDRFYNVRLPGLNPMVRATGDGTLDIVLLFGRDMPRLTDIKPEHLRLFSTPVINLFERECNIIELDHRRSQQVLHADRTRPREFEIYRLLRVSDADRDGAASDIPPLFSIRGTATGGAVYATERRPRRPGEDEIRNQMMRTSYAGDDMFVSLSYPPGESRGRSVRRLDVRALCTNRDLPILDDEPKLTMDTGDPVSRVELTGRVRPPRASLPSVLPRDSGGESRLDDLSWRLIGQLSLNFLSLAEGQDGAEPLKALLALYADRGDPEHARHARAVTRVQSRPVVERLPIAGPICFGHGVEIDLSVDEDVLTGFSKLVLPALLDQLFARHAGVNSFIKSRTRLVQTQEIVSWPMTPGNRSMI